MKASCRVLALAAGFLTLLPAPVCNASITIQDAFCRGGQVFLHWSDPATSYTHYHVYRSDAVIDSSNLAGAEAVDLNSPLCGAKDYTATYVALQYAQPDPNVGLRITDLGPTLSTDDGLKVMTVKAPAQHYYCVVGVLPNGTEDGTLTVGGNSTASPVQETLGPPSPVVEQQGVAGGCPYKLYIWYRRDDEAMRDGEPTKVSVSSPPDFTKIYPTMLYLHFHGYFNVLLSYSTMVTICPCDYTSYLPYHGHTWWYGHADHYPDLTTGTVVNYTENMLVHMMQWAEANLPVDANRVFIGGGSMGGTGGVSFGLRHPELFAGIGVQVPQVNPGLPGAGFQDQLSAIWGSVATNLPADEGLGVWDRMNMVKYVTDHKEDLPYLVLQNGRADTMLPWFQDPDFYRALNASRHGYIAAWGPGGHTTSSIDLPPVYTSFSLWEAVRLNQSYVAVSNSSANNNPGNGDPLDGDIAGQMGGGLTWTILSDTPDEWSATLTNALGRQFYADISARRLQSFSFLAGSRLAYSLSDSASSALTVFGRVYAERDRFFVLPQLPIGVNASKLAVWPSGTQTIANLSSAAENDPVDLDAVVVTAVFPEVTYAQALERLPAVAILGATGLAEGDLIRLKGTRSRFAGLPAVHASPVAPTSYGKMALDPFGITDPSRIAGIHPLMLGLLVKVWGTVYTVGAGWFTVRTAGHSVLIFGSIGNPPQSGARVSVVGICCWSWRPNSSVSGIRVRRETDIVTL